MKRWFSIIALISSLLLLLTWRGTFTPRQVHTRPHTRTFTIITIPLLTKEQQSTYPFLQKSFAKGGVLEGKEVYSFQPATLTVYHGDRVNLTFVNPEDDIHTFVLKEYHLSVVLPAQATTKTQFVANTIGAFQFLCGGSKLIHLSRSSID